MSIVYRGILNQFNFCFKIKDVREQGSSNRCNHYANKYFERQLSPAILSQKRLKFTD
jgi:hypothetical protein